jgi:hypothetical protein
MHLKKEQFLCNVIPLGCDIPLNKGPKESAVELTTPPPLHGVIKH